MKLCGGVGGSLKVSNNSRRAARLVNLGKVPKLECGLANTSVVFGEVIQHGVGIALLTLHFKLYGGLVGMYVFDLIFPF